MCTTTVQCDRGHVTPRNAIPCLPRVLEARRGLSRGTKALELFASLPPRSYARIVSDSSKPHLTSLPQNTTSLICSLSSKHQEQTTMSYYPNERYGGGGGPPPPPQVPRPWYAEWDGRDGRYIFSSYYIFS